MSLAASQPKLSYAFAREHGVLLSAPHEAEDDASPILYVSPAADAKAAFEARRVAGRPVALQHLDAESFSRRLSEFYAVQGVGTEGLEATGGDDDLATLVDEMPKAADLLDVGADDAPVVRLINGLIAEAVQSRASDIHVEPFENQVSIRLRIDGVLQEVLSIPPRAAAPLVSRIKVMARLDIAEKRTPQDGRISLTLGGRSLDVRVSTLPSRHGERAVLRLLDREGVRLDLETLGMGETTLNAFKAALREPNGVILVTGPTGSGKTTTLYGGLHLLNDRTRNILTVEDPVEYELEGVGQTQVNTRVGMTFAAGLRAILRQDPDVVMVGEIRDGETAEIAVQASLTGHLVLSTVHTNDAVSAVTRLRDLGVESFLLSTTLKAILAQRLVRRLCPDCKSAHTPTKAERALLNGLKADVLYQARGCQACKATGYRGRLGLYELVRVDDTIRRLILEDKSEADITAHAFKAQDKLYTSGLRHVAAGVTTLEEVMRVCRVEEGDASL